MEGDTEWGNVFSDDIYDKGIVSKIFKELIKFNTQKITQIRNGQENE